jgi:predicted membrane protein
MSAVATLREWVWVFLVFWIFITVFAEVKKDEIAKMIAGLIGIVFGIMYISTNFLIGLGMILINFYLLLDAITS